MSIGCNGTWMWAGGNKMSISFTNDEPSFGAEVRSLKIEIDGVTLPILDSGDMIHALMQPAGAQDLDLVVPIVFAPPNPSAQESYSLVCKATALVTKDDGTELTTLVETCSCTVEHNAA
jgi:hypothetical protein